MSELPRYSVPEHPTRRPTLVGEDMEGVDEVIYIDNETGTSVSLNSIGAAVLELCDGQHTSDDIANIVIETLGGDKTQIKRDIDHILEEFAAYGLLKE